MTHSSADRGMEERPYKAPAICPVTEPTVSASPHLTQYARVERRRGKGNTCQEFGKDSSVHKRFIYVRLEVSRLN